MFDYSSGWIVRWCVPSLQLAIDFLTTRCTRRDPLLRLIYLPLTKNLTFLVLFDFIIQKATQPSSELPSTQTPINRSQDPVAKPEAHRRELVWQGPALHFHGQQWAWRGQGQWHHGDRHQGRGPLGEELHRDRLSLPPIGGGETPVQVRQAIPRNQAAAACLPMLLSSTNLISREVPTQHLGQAEQIKKLREEYLEKQSHLAVRFIEY